MNRTFENVVEEAVIPVTASQLEESRYKGVEVKVLQILNQRLEGTPPRAIAQLCESISSQFLRCAMARDPISLNRPKITFYHSSKG